MKKNALLLTLILSLLLSCNPLSCQKKKEGAGPDTKSEGDLQVLNLSPSDSGLPITTEGITVMFDHPMVALTTLDAGRSQAIDIEITPPVDGKFTWLGTRGFILRPDKPFQPATTYTVTIPAGLESLDHYVLPQKVTKTFSTVAPKLISTPRGSTLLPGKAVLYFQFNLAMNVSEVEKALTIQKSDGGKIDIPFKTQWEEDNHVLLVRFTKNLPPETDLKVVLPAGLHAAQGDLGTLIGYENIFSVPPAKASLTGVKLRHYDSNEGLVETPLVASTEKLIDAGDSVCYYFSQAVTKKSFEKAVTVETTASGKKPNPYFYVSDYASFDYTDDKGRLQYDEGNQTGCVSFADEYDQPYSVTLDPEKIEVLSGARLVAKKETFLLRTGHAGASFESSLTKNIFSREGGKHIPYHGVNLTALNVRIYSWPADKPYDEGIKNSIMTQNGKWDSNFFTPSADNTGNLAGNNLPFDSATQGIDIQRMPPAASKRLTLSPRPDKRELVSVDLDDVYGSNIPNGIYLVEALPEAEGKSMSSRFSMVQVTNVALTLKREIDHVLVWATDIESGKPLEDLPLILYRTTANESGYQVITDKNGLAVVKGSFANNIISDAYCAEVQKPGFASLSCQDMHGLQSYRETLGRSANEFAYIYTDRPIYRPGQDVYYSAFIRQVREARYFLPETGREYKLAVLDASGDHLSEPLTLKAGSGGVVHGSFSLPEGEDTPRGDYSLKIESPDGQIFTKTFVVASYRKPSFKVDASSKKDEVISREKFKVEVTGNYFFGAPLKKAPLTWSLITSTYRFSPEGYEGYSFIDSDLLSTGYNEYGDYEYYGDSEGDYYSYSTDESSHKQDDPRNSGSAAESSSSSGSSGFFTVGKKKEKNIPGHLDEKGRFVITYTPDLKDYPTSQVLSVEAAVTDPSHQQVASSASLVVHKANVYLGLKPEKWIFGEKDKARFDVVSLNTEGKPAAHQSFTAEIFRREYKFVEKRTAGGNWDFSFEKQDVKIESGSDSTDSSGKGKIEFKIPQGGTYYVVLTGLDKHDNEIRASQTIEAWGEGYVPWKLDKPEIIDLVADKDSYEVGDTAKILVKSLVPVSKALLTLERGRVLESRVIELGGNADHLEIPITAGMAPNIFVNIMAHAPREDKRPPMLFTGEVALSVNPESRRLTVSVTTDKTGSNDKPPLYRPGDEVTVKVKTTDAAGLPRRAHVMVSVADESVLRLLSYNLPDLVKKFFWQRPNSVLSSSSLLSLKAGDGNGPSAGKLRTLFKDTAHFEGDVVTDKNGEATFTFKLPDNLTTWVIEALAITESKTWEAFEQERKAADTDRAQALVDSDLKLDDGTLVGGTRAKLITTLPVHLRAALPRFAAWGDTVTGSIIANNQNPQPAKGVIDIFISGDGILAKSSTDIPFDLKPGEEKTYPFEFRAAYATGHLKLKAQARDQDNILLDGFENTIPVLDRYQPERVATFGMTSETATEKIDIPASIQSDKGGLDVTLRASLATALAAPLRDLIYYPYGCSEQKSATLMALLLTKSFSDSYGEKFFDQLAPFKKADLEGKSFSEKKKMLDDQVTLILGDLENKYVAGDGGMKYWPNSRESDYFPSVQVFWAYQLAQELGYGIPAEFLERLANYLTRFLDNPPDWIDDEEKSYVAFGLSRGGIHHAVITDLASRRESLSVSALAMTLLAASGDPQQASEIGKIQNRLLSLSEQTPRHTQWPGHGYFLGSAKRNTALAALAVFKNSPENPVVPRALAFLLNHKKNKSAAASTQEALWLSYVGYEISRSTGETQADLEASVKLADVKVLEKHFDTSSILDEAHKNLPMKDLKAAGSAAPTDLIIAHSGNGPLFYDLMLTYYLPPEHTPPREEGMVVSRNYYALDDVKEEHPLTTFKVGENYKGHITLVLPKDMDYPLIREELPAGFEPIDMTLAISSRAAQLESQAQEETSPAAGYSPYADVVVTADYGMDYAFSHQEIHDDAILWSDDGYLPAGTYHIRYPVRATTAGTFLMPGATAFGFYEPEVFGRSRPQTVNIQ